MAKRKEFTHVEETENATLRYDVQSNNDSGCLMTYKPRHLTLEELGELSNTPEELFENAKYLSNEDALFFMARVKHLATMC